MIDAKKHNQKQRDKFVASLEKLIAEIDEIDSNTMWEEIEPQWWLNMMDFQKSARHSLNLLDKNWIPK